MYKQSNKVSSVTIDYIFDREYYTQDHIEDIDSFAYELKNAIRQSSNSIIEVETNDNELLMIDTPKIQNVIIAYKD